MDLEGCGLTEMLCTNFLNGLNKTALIFTVADAAGKLPLKQLYAIMTVKLMRKLNWFRKQSNGKLLLYR
jgi:hypothetical protein